MPQTTTLATSPSPSFYLDGMELGTGIDAITGEIKKSALNKDFIAKDVPSTSSGDTFTFRPLSDTTELESSDALGFSGSITFPADGVNVSAKRTFDFTSSNQSSTAFLLILLNWERHGQAKQVSNAKLSAEASSNLAHNKASFRSHYGDYFVYQISYMTKFTAVWKCTAEKSSDIKEFKQEISASISQSEMEASGSFTTKLSRAAKNHRVTVEVQYQVVGNAGNTQYDKGDVHQTFNSFRKAASPIPYEILLRHYSSIDTKVPVVIDMEPEVFKRVCNVFTNARFVLFLIGVVPGTRSVRINRRDKISRIFTEIHTDRLAYQHNPNALKNTIKELADMRSMLWKRLERQDLVTEMRSLTYDDFKKKFAVDHENDRGAWVQSSENVPTYVLGRISSEDSSKYAVSHKDVAEVHVSSTLFQQQVGALEFPGTSGINGYLVGLIIKSCWTDGTNGWWCIGKELVLGTKQAKVEVKTEGSRGMHWQMTAYYIPSSEYDEE